MRKFLLDGYANVLFGIIILLDTVLNPPKNMPIFTMCMIIAILEILIGFRDIDREENKE